MRYHILKGNIHQKGFSTHPHADEELFKVRITFPELLQQKQCCSVLLNS